MPVIEWAPRFATGHARVDQQHQQLFKLVNDLHDAMRAGKGRDQIGKTLDALASYTTQHFATEEQAMTASQYPGIAAHKAAHAKLLADATAFIAGFKTGKAVTTVDISGFLADWLKHHIDGEDMKLVAYLRDRR